MALLALFDLHEVKSMLRTAFLLMAVWCLLAMPIAHARDYTGSDKPGHGAFLGYIQPDNRKPVRLPVGEDDQEFVVPFEYAPPAKPFLLVKATLNDGKVWTFLLDMGGGC